MHRIGRVHLLLTALLVMAACLVPQLPARAAGYGPGFDIGLGRIGAYVTPLGTQAYCLEISKNRPLGATDSGTVGGWAGLDAEALARLNWVLQSFGQSPDPVVTAAVNLYVWSVADPGTYGSHGVSGDDYYSGRAGAAKGAVLDALARIRAEAGPPRGSVELELRADLSGRAVVRDPAGAGGALTLEGAESLSPVQVTDGSVVEFTAVVAPGAGTATVAAEVQFAAQSYQPAITVHDSGPDQHLAGPAGDALIATASATVPLEFHPVLESSVARPVVSLGDAALDRLEVSVAADSPAPWLAGSRVVAIGRLYGPFASPPSEAASAPPDAPIAWTERVEVDGPGSVTTSGAFAPTEPGHYTWVWSYDSADQPGGSLLPGGYRWADRFGLPDESFEVVVPLPATGPSAPPWLAAVGAVLAGTGLTGVAAVMRMRRGRS